MKGASASEPLPHKTPGCPIWLPKMPGGYGRDPASSTHRMRFLKVNYWIPGHPNVPMGFLLAICRSKVYSQANSFV